MREIKFRIWADNQFYYKCLVGNTNDTSDDNWTCPMVWLEDKKEWVNCDNGIISQFTGLKDKNGVEIYEGDIIRKQQYWGDKKSGFVRKEIKWNEKECRFNITSKSKDYEVIGNIYEGDK